MADNPYDVHIPTLERITKMIETRFEEYKERAENTSTRDRERGRRFEFAAAALLNLHEDITSIIEEVKPQNPLSKAAAREVENLINDALIELKGGKKGDAMD